MIDLARFCKSLFEKYVELKQACLKLENAPWSVTSDITMDIFN